MGASCAKAKDREDADCFWPGLLVGVALAGFAVYIAQDRFAQYQNALREQRNAIIETTEVYVVNTQLRYGQTLRPEHVQAVLWPADHVPFGAFQTMEEIFPEGTEVPRTVLRVMERDEPILLSKVTAPGRMPVWPRAFRTATAPLRCRSM